MPAVLWGLAALVGAGAYFVGKVDDANDTPDEIIAKQGPNYTAPLLIGAGLLAVWWMKK